MSILFSLVESMKNLNIYIQYYSARSTSSFADTVQNIINQLELGEQVPVKFAFFGNPKNDIEYFNELKIIKETVRNRFGIHSPVISYVAQKPLCNNALVLETHSSIISSESNIHYRSFGEDEYVVIEDANAKTLHLGGVLPESTAKSTFEQSMQIFEKIQMILEKEKMPINSIVRQWNYIANITQVVDGKQHYQEFNDARSHFYEKATWEKGYPAATGIGTSFGGVVVDLIAVKPKKNKVEVFALDNQLQVPAHDYSQGVLVGKEDAFYKVRTTPKFERGKVISTPPESLVYVSGTAAIRGEETLENVGVKVQTVATLENIEYLISKENIKKAGVESEKPACLKSLRIYLKEASFYEEAKNVIDQKYPNIPMVYLLGDVCRDNLLIEIEGIAT